MVRQCAQTADRTQKGGFQALEDQRAVECRKYHEGKRGNARNQDDGVVVQSAHGAEQQMHEIDIAAPGGYQQNAQSQRYKIEGGKARVFVQHGAARHKPRGERNDDSGNRTAERHGRQR